MKNYVLFITVIASLAMSAIAYSVTDYFIVKNETEVLVQQTSSLVKDKNKVNLQINELEAKNTDLTVEIENLKKVEALRPVYLESISKLEAVLTAGESKIKTGEDRSLGYASQERFLAATNEQEAQAEIDSINSLTASVTQKISDYDEAIRQAVRNSPLPRDTNMSGMSGDYVERARSILNSIGGNWVNLIGYDGTCGGKFAVGCAVPGTIKIHSSWDEMDGFRKNWAIWHEYAHQFHFNNWDAVNNSSIYQSIFYGNPETLANCMAGVKGYAVTYCSAEQKDYAWRIWNNNP